MFLSTQARDNGPVFGNFIINSFPEFQMQCMSKRHLKIALAETRLLIYSLHSFSLLLHEYLPLQERISQFLVETGWMVVYAMSC